MERSGGSESVTLEVSKDLNDDEKIIDDIS